MNGNPTTFRWLQILREFRALEPEPVIREWVEAQRIPIKATHNRQAHAAGKVWNFTDFPVMADWTFDFILNATTELLFRDGSTRTVKNRTAALMKDAQSGQTTVVLHALAWWLQWRGGNVIMITATRDLARDSGKDKIDLLDDYPKLRDTKLKSSTSMAMRYPRSIVWLGGGQSSGSVISNPASLVICDEVAKHTLVNGMIPMTLLEGRITADDEGKQISFSTPDDALEFVKNPHTGREEPVVTVETAIHASYLQGTQEVVECPCPHCGHYQELDWERLRFEHCRESLGIDKKPIWNRDRVVKETWYQCINADCTDRHPDGTVRGRIEERLHKRTMIERRRIVATNLEYRSGHRSLQAGGMYNLAFASRSWGAIADAFITAQIDGSSAAYKAFMTDVIGKPYARYQVKSDALESIRKLRRGYRRLNYDGTPRLQVPLNTEEILAIGLMFDVQRTPGMALGDIGAIKWLIFAAGHDSQTYVLDWGTAAAMEELPDIIESRKFCSRNEDIHHLTIDVVCGDTGYAKEKVFQFLTHEGGSRSTPRWCALRGGSTANDAALRGRPRITREFPGVDKYNNKTVLRVLHVRAEHFEAELHIERIAKHADGTRTAPQLHLPSDADDDFLTEVSNAETYWDKPDKGRLRQLRWRKRESNHPNDHADNIRNALAVIEAICEEIATGTAQL